MPNVVEYIGDTAYLLEIIELLKSSYGVNAFIVDGGGNAVEGLNSLPADPDPEPAFRKFYPFEFTEDIGGFMCASTSEDAVLNADRFINASVTAVNAILQRELEIQQMGGEIVELSEQINFLFNLAKKVMGLRKLREFCEMSLFETAKKIDADSGFVIVKDARNENIVIPYRLGEDDVMKIRTQDVFGLAAKKRDAVLSKLDNGMSALVSPIEVKDGVIGFMAFLREKDRRFFTAYEKKFVGIIDDSISSTVETLRLYDNLKEVYLNTVKALAAAIDAKDPYTHGHSFRVAKYSVAIARKLNFPEDTVVDIEVAGYMHDIGKIGVLDTVLRKAGKLTDEEYDEIKKHPGFTWRILEPIRLPENIVLAASQHHERLDGRGYPLGLKAEDIHQFAKIIAVADVFDALTSDRTYRPAITVEKALTMLCDGKDNEFDREIVMALIEALKDGLMVQVLEDIYRDLRYSDLQNLNQFLVMIAGRLLQPAAGINEERLTG
ncbi:MAG TPA: HD-GYP domain-containing protein [Nitrospiraceae bacterium]|nr:MAG: hypothetical protein A2Z82_09245 [Nitrospirae bacterium GWA2_46_11]OGW25108.1 MAG: hypothetical protein A2X55_05630 [Nitrospirae bacterium GWB2_47_37]HAK88630.1 HD-GYP domain-containing protein [Nitrospiraceae bacterium]HCZ11002.1 HD-GYP domain-containing protein [Nitrospiraceae bacterium]